MRKMIGNSGNTSIQYFDFHDRCHMKHVLFSLTDFYTKYSIGILLNTMYIYKLGTTFPMRNVLGLGITLFLMVKYVNNKQMKNYLYKIFFFFLNRFKHYKVQYNIINMYHIKYHIMPSANRKIRLQLISIWS